MYYAESGTPLSPFWVWGYSADVMRWKSEKQVDRERNSFLLKMLREASF